MSTSSARRREINLTVLWTKFAVYPNNSVTKMSGCLVQYVVIRKDLVKVLKWPTGALITQACHACTAVMHLFYNDPNTQQYLNDLDRMHKVVLEVGGML